ncbi:equilibrative nucleoside transporter 1 isoform X2 [Diprion similis]|nr:equilibrative nucleoside transporter 1 isoform X2 [Diprion similis]XP_046739542.1 equilibrative nucleoside transporter 1 isoform X2 [Diprion similis]XP_046739543.1 equilibrative nucleoside transporter 1 isoform X2 [Diprion similis]
MSYSINRRPLLAGVSDSEFEDDLTEVDDPSVVIRDEKPLFKPHEPLDKYKLAYIIFYFLGMNTLIPWSFFVTANDYWMYKFREIHVNNTGRHNYTHTENLEKRNDLQASFTSYLSVASAIPNTLFLVVNTFISKKMSLRMRMVGSQFIVFLLFLLTTALIKVNTDEWQNLFFIITLTTVAAINASCAIFGGSLMGIAGRFSSGYITAMMGGQALGGIFTALAEIGSLWIGASPVLSGLVYFIIGDVMLFLSLVAYMILEKAVFFKYHMLEDSSESLIASDRDNHIPGGNSQDVSYNEGTISYFKIFKKIWHYGLSEAITFLVTIAVYPAVTVLVDSQNKGQGHAWNDIYFIPVVAYLLFSIGDYAGRILAGLLEWPKNRPWVVIFLSIIRAVFVPAIMVCNAHPRHHLPVYITDDIDYILITMGFAFTNGYLCNIVLILTPLVVEPEEKEIASAMMGAFLGAGLTIGSIVSLGMVKLL